MNEFTQRPDEKGMTTATTAITAAGNRIADGTMLQASEGPPVGYREEAKALKEYDYRGFVFILMLISLVGVRIVFARVCRR